jgi:hypothetical protein
VNFHGGLAKYDSLGNSLWSEPFPYGMAIAVDGAENIYATGYGKGVFDGLALTNSAGLPDFFVAKCNPQGNCLWARNLGGTQQKGGSGIALDPSGNIYVSCVSMQATIEPMLTFGTTVLTNVFTFFVAYDSAGNPLWAQPVFSSYRTGALCIAARGAQNIYAGGYFIQTGQFGPFDFQNFDNGDNFFVTKLAGSYPPAGAVLNVLPSSPGNPFRCSVTGLPGYNYAVQASPDLINWMTLVTNASPFVFVDTNAALSQRFYRAVYLP